MVKLASSRHTGMVRQKQKRELKKKQKQQLDAFLWIINWKMEYV